MPSMYRPTVASQEMAGLKVVEPRMARVAPVELDGERVILTLGTEVPRSSMLLTPFCSRVSASKAAMEMGVSCRDCSLFWAVTTTSSRPWAGTWLASMVEAAATAAAMALMRRMSNHSCSRTGKLAGLCWCWVGPPGPCRNGRCPDPELADHIG